MSSSFRARSDDGGSIAEAKNLDDLIAAVKLASPGHYRIDKISLDPTTGAVRSWEWGAITRHHDGEIWLDLPAWLD